MPPLILGQRSALRSEWKARSQAAKKTEKYSGNMVRAWWRSRWRPFLYSMSGIKGGATQENTERGVLINKGGGSKKLSSEFLGQAGRPRPWGTCKRVQSKSWWGCNRTRSLCPSTDEGTARIKGVKNGSDCGAKNPRVEMKGGTGGKNTSDLLPSSG